MIPNIRVYYDGKMYNVVRRINYELEVITVFNEYADDRRGRHDLHLGFREATIIQSTGLKDRNSKEIFKGDIIHWIRCERRIKIDMGKYKIIFKNGKFSTERPDIPIGHFSKSEIKIIGNIYENKELLE